MRKTLITIESEPSSATLDPERIFGMSTKNFYRSNPDKNRLTSALILFAIAILGFLVITADAQDTRTSTTDGFKPSGLASNQPEINLYSLDEPGPADYDGDGKADVGMYRPGNYPFWWYGSGDGQSHGVTLNHGDVVVSSDYDGDGKADPAIFDEDTAYGYIHQSTSNSLVSTQWGGINDVPVQNDYDGDGKTDLATCDNTGGIGPPPEPAVWTIRRSSNGTTRTEYWGNNGDIPVPAYYRR